MSNIFDQIFGAIILSLAIGIGLYAWTNSLVFSAKTASEIDSAKTEIKNNESHYEELNKKIESIQDKFDSITELTDSEKKEFELKNNLSELRDSYRQLMNVVEDKPEKIIELKSLKVNQEANFKILNTKIESEVKVLNEKIISLRSALEVAKYYNDILISMVVIMLGAVWAQHRSIYKKSSNPGVDSLGS